MHAECEHTSVACQMVASNGVVLFEHAVALHTELVLLAAGDHVGALGQLIHKLHTAQLRRDVGRATHLVQSHQLVQRFHLDRVVVLFGRF